MPPTARALIFMAVLLLPVAALAEEMPLRLPGAHTVDAAELIGLAERHDNLVVIDARLPSDYHGGHIPSAINLPNTETDAERLAEVLERLDTPVVFYCNGPRCERSVESVHTALAAGYQHVYWYRGGMEHWLAEQFLAQR